MSSAARESFAVHVLVDDKFIDSALREFEAAAPGRQRYVLPGKPRPLRYVSWPNVEFVRRRRLAALLNQRRCRGVVFHSLENRDLPLLSRLRPGRTVAWLGWGFDYYDRLLTRAFPGGLYLPRTRVLVDTRSDNTPAPSPPKAPLRERLAQLCGTPPPSLEQRLARIDLFCPVLEVEQRWARALCPTFRADYVDWNYGTAEDDYGALPFEAASPVGREILVGNSATATNNHLEVFELLARTPAAYDRRIIVPLSYGDAWYRDEILERGRALFGERFVPLVDYVAPDAYRALLQSAGHFFLGHVRQQAVGNICIMLLKGARLYVNTQNPVHTWLGKLGAHVDALQPEAGGFAAHESALHALDELARRHNHGAVLARFGKAPKRAKTARFVAQLLGASSDGTAGESH